jgi:hypothetical protein
VAILSAPCAHVIGDMTEAAAVVASDCLSNFGAGDRVIRPCGNEAELYSAKEGFLVVQKLYGTGGRVTHVILCEVVPAPHQSAGGLYRHLLLTPVFFNGWQRVTTKD